MQGFPVSFNAVPFLLLMHGKQSTFESISIECKHMKYSKVFERMTNINAV